MYAYPSYYKKNFIIIYKKIFIPQIKKKVLYAKYKDDKFIT